MFKEKPPLKKPGLLETAALLTGLALAPKQAELEPRSPVMSVTEQARLSTERFERRMMRLEREIHPSLPPRSLSLESTAGSFYSPGERSELLGFGFDIGLRTYKVLFAEDLMRLEGAQDNEPSLDPETIAELAEQAINQEVDQLPERGYKTEKGEDYRERMRSIAKDTLLLALRQDLLLRMCSTYPERAQDLLTAFSSWDPTDQILPSEVEEQQGTDGSITFSDRARNAVLQDLSRPLPKSTTDSLLYERSFGDLDSREEE